MYKRYLSISDKSVALDNVWRRLKLAYGYRVADPMNKISEQSNKPVVENSIKGVQDLQKDLIYCLHEVDKSQEALLDNPVLINNFVRRLPETFRSQYHFRALDSDTTCKFDNLMKYITHAIQATEHNPEVWGEQSDSSKDNKKNSNRGCASKTDNASSSRNYAEASSGMTSFDKQNETSLRETRC